MILYVKTAAPLSQENAHIAWTKSLSIRNTYPIAEIVSIGSNDITTLAGEDDIGFWAKYVCRGEKLTQASVRNKDTATNYVTGIDSRFDGSMETELETWDYTEHKGKSLYCELDNIAATLNSIGIDAKFRKGNNNGQNECFHVEHRRTNGGGLNIRDQTYEAAGRTYRVSSCSLTFMYI